MKKQIPWKFHQIAVKSEPVFFAAIANNELEPACKDIGGIEVKIAGMMTSSKEHNKANKQFRLECMRESVEVIINDRPYPAEVSYEMMDGEVTDINTLFLIIDGLHQNFHYMIEELKEDIAEDIIEALKKRNEL